MEGERKSKSDEKRIVRKEGRDTCNVQYASRRTNFGRESGKAKK